MMKDRFFYPLAALVVVAIIVLALKPGTRAEGLTDAQIAQQGFELKGVDLERLTAGPGTLLSFVNDGFGDTDYAILSTNLPRNMAQASAGVFATLGPQYEAVFAGRLLSIEIEARANPDAPLEEFDMGYFTAETGDSGWRRHALTDDFETYTMIFTPKPGTNPGNDYFGIWPGEDGKSQAMDVRVMRIRIISDGS